MHFVDGVDFATTGNHISDLLLLLFELFLLLHESFYLIIMRCLNCLLTAPGSDTFTATQNFWHIDVVFVFRQLLYILEMIVFLDEVRVLLQITLQVML